MMERFYTREVEKHFDADMETEKPGFMNIKPMTGMTSEEATAIWERRFAELAQQMRRESDPQ